MSEMRKNGIVGEDVLHKWQKEMGYDHYMQEEEKREKDKDWMEKTLDKIEGKKWWVEYMYYWQLIKLI